jgi:pyridoxamine 5'-phosphate oxidase
VSEKWVPLNEEDVDASPFVQFRRWFDEAKPVMAEREAIVVATANERAMPSARMVLLRHYDDTSFGWFTNYESRKGHEIAENPFSALLWYCEALGRQIRIEGTTEKMSPSASDAYFASRARGSQIGAHASQQSAVIRDRATLEQRVIDVASLYDEGDVPRPSNWGGYVLTPARFEFWQHRDDRLHDRLVYLRHDGGEWKRERLSP